MIRITEVSLRDGHQSLLATRMRTEDLIEAAKIFDEVGFFSCEVWGGATYDACLRYLKEDPFERLRKFKSVFKKTPLQMLLRGQNLVGYRHYADDVVCEFIELSAINGIDIFRIFDALNDVRNIELSAKEVKKHGKHAQLTISYTISPVHTHKNFIELAKIFEDLGADSICIKDMAGLLSPFEAYSLISELKSAVSVPIHLHSHSTAGFAFGTHLKAIEAGVDGIDLAVSALSDGTSHPCTQSMVATLKGTKYDTGLNLEKLEVASDILRQNRAKYKKFESEYNMVDSKVLINQIPGGMISNLANQLREQNALDRMDEVLKEVPNVRSDLGYPPLVTPTSQIVGTQAVLNVISNKRYAHVTRETKNYVKGLYGKPPAPISDEIKKLILGDEEQISIRPAELLESELPKAIEESSSFAKSREDVISYALFGSVAKQFFLERNTNTLKPEPLTILDTNEELPNEFAITIHGERYQIKIEGAGQRSEDLRPFFVRVDGELKEVFVESIKQDNQKNINKPLKEGELPLATSNNHIKSQMPGNVIKINVKAGDRVKEGEVLCVIEAMKMENEILAHCDCEVIEVYAKEGIQVQPNQAIMLVG